LTNAAQIHGRAWLHRALAGPGRVDAVQVRLSQWPTSVTVVRSPAVSRQWPRQDFRDPCDDLRALLQNKAVGAGTAWGSDMVHAHRRRSWRCIDVWRQAGTTQQIRGLCATSTRLAWQEDDRADGACRSRSGDDTIIIRRRRIRRCVYARAYR